MANKNFFENRTALVTGASGGIGKAVCRKLAGRGMKLFITGRNPEKLQETAPSSRSFK